MNVSIQFDKPNGRIKPMNAVNNGPVSGKKSEQNLGNFDEYTEANIPFARTHDSSFYVGYGGEHTVDVHNIFTNFDADPELPESYDFFYTDKYLNDILSVGTQVYFRLGTKIEHGPKKYGANPPKDFKKWAVICEHIIRHYNEGWADGFHMGIIYWEIWNEPDGAPNWTGTPEQFYDLYAITSKHLKECFPNLKIGGPALACVEEWLDNFLKRVKNDNLPIDFFSWHGYAHNISDVVSYVRKRKKILNDYGFTNVESHMNEWNYTDGWSGEGWSQTLKVEKSMKGAAYIAGVMTACQEEPVDMLMYYDARPNSGMNGLFDYPFLEVLKGYYPIKTWGEMLKLGNACKSSSTVPDVYVVAATNENEQIAMLTYYTDDETACPKTFNLELSGTNDREMSLYLLDEKHDMEKTGLLYPNKGLVTLTMEPNTVVVIRIL